MQIHSRCINHNFASVLKIHRDTVAYDRLHLANAPIGLTRMGDQIAGNQQGFPTHHAIVHVFPPQAQK